MKIFKKISKKELFGLILMLVSLLCFISILIYNDSEQPGGINLNEIQNKLGLFGIWIGYYLHYYFMGYSSVSFPVIMFVLGYAMFSNKKIKIYKNLFIYIFLLSLWSSVFMAYLNESKGGIIGHSLNSSLQGI